MNVALIIASVIFWIVEIFILGNAFLGIVGLFKAKRKYQIVEDKERFCIFVPCHNEGPVIESTVLNYAKINYDENLFNIYFIADNCTDNTAALIKGAIEASKKKNFFVLERNVSDPNKKGKPHALRWAMDLLEESDSFYSKYSLFMIFDADNFVDADILKHVNSQYLSFNKDKPAMIQCYLDSKNKNSLVARSYYAGYRISNRIAQASRNTLHLVPAIGGTGFAMSVQFLKDIGGYNCKSLTEDLEIQAIATMRGKRVIFNEFARIYDEKPTGIKQSVVQRTRWAQGHWYLCFLYCWRLFLSIFNPKTIKDTFRKIDMIFYLNSMFFMCLSVVSFLFQLFFSIYGGVTHSEVDYLAVIIGCGYSWFNSLLATIVTITNLVILIITLLILPALTSLYDGGKEEKKSILKDYIPNILALFILSFIQIVSAWLGLFKCRNQKVWRKTAHKVTNLQQ